MEKQYVCYIFLLCFCLVSGKYHLRLESMHCSSTEDTTGSDDILVKRKKDGTSQPELEWNDVEKGQYHYWHDQYSNFSHSLEIEVIEEDSFIEIDDDIGDFTITGSNIKEEYKWMDPPGMGEYSLTWTDLTPHYNEIVKKKDEYKNKFSRRSSGTQTKKIEEHVNGKNEHHKAKYIKMNDHLNQGHRKRKTHKAIMKTVHTFKKTTDKNERCEMVKILKHAVGFDPLRGIIEEIEHGNWPTIILYGMFSPINFGFFDFVGAYGIAVQANGCDAGIVFAYGADVGFTEGDEGRIAIGLNRNSLSGVAGWTYSYTVPSYDQLTGGVTLSFDLDLVSPNLQEVEYSYSLLPQGHSAGLSYTVLVKNP